MKYQAEKLYLRTHPINVLHSTKDETAQEKYVREISEIAKVYVKSLLELQRGI